MTLSDKEFIVAIIRKTPETYQNGILKKCSGTPKKGTIAMLLLCLELQSILKSAAFLDDDPICSFRHLNSLMLLHFTFQ